MIGEYFKPNANVIGFVASSAVLPYYLYTEEKTRRKIISGTISHEYKVLMTFYIFDSALQGESRITLTRKLKKITLAGAKQGSAYQISQPFNKSIL